MRISDWSSDVCSSDLNGVTLPQSEMAHVLQVNQGTISKWLSGSRRPDRYAAAIISLHHSLTGKKVELPVVTGETDEHISKVIELMQRLGPEDRAQIGRASCRERVCRSGEILEVAASRKKKKPEYSRT